MLIQLQDALKPYGNLKLQHRGFVVKIDDPLHLGRIKCKVEGVIESGELDDLPWCFPKEPTTRGGRPDSCVTAVPPLYSTVIIEFPARGDSPIGGGNVYYPVWVGMARMDISNPTIGEGSNETEDAGLSEPYGVGASHAEDLEVNVWVKTNSQNVCWIRVDKNKGSIEFFDQDSDATIRVDRGGHVQLQVTSLDVVTKEDVRFKVGRDFHASVAGSTYFDSVGNIGFRTFDSFSINADKDIDNKAGGAIGEQAGTTIGMIAGTDIGAKAGAAVSIKAASTSTVEAGAAMSLIAGGLLSGQGAVIGLDAALISENGGVSQGSLSDPRDALGTNATVMGHLATSKEKLLAREGALATLVEGLVAEAAHLKEVGQHVLATVKEWAAKLLGAHI